MKRGITSRRAWRIAGTLAGLTLAMGTACSDLGSGLDPFQPEVTSATDDFQFQASGFTNIDASKAWTWQNTGTRATVNHATTTAGGSAHVVIRDANGVIVYDKDLTSSLTEPTATGAAGTWNIRVTLTHFSGSINFRVQKL